MEKLLLLFGKGFVEDILNVKNVHAFQRLKPGTKVPWLILTELELQVM